MKKNLTIALLLILFAFTCQAQKLYSQENLEKASQQDLQLRLEQAKKLEKTGKNLTFTGPLIFAAGYGLGALAWSGGTEGMWQLGFGMIVVGPIITLAGLSMLITGSSRVERINKLKQTGDNAKLSLAPSSIYSHATQNYQPGITLRLTF